MLDSETYKAVLKEIVDIYFPDELEAFEAGGDNVVLAAMTEGQTTNNDGSNRRYGVDWGTTKTILEIVVVAFNAWKVIQELQKFKKEEFLQQDLDDRKVWFENELEKLLVEGKISRKKARAIAAHIGKKREIKVE